MKSSRLGYLVEPLREMIYQADMIIRGYREKKGIKVAGLSCDILPFEVLASFGILPLRIPLQAGNTFGCAAGELSPALRQDEVYDYIIIPGKCCGRKGSMAPALEFISPAGYGEEAAIGLHHAMDALLREMGLSGIKELDARKLAEVTESYNVMRRLIRGIAEARRGKPDLLSNEDLFLLFESAMVLPPEHVTDTLAAVLETLNREQAKTGKTGFSVMAAGGYLREAGILDGMEEAGCLVAEDDFCNGRRQFDLSHNASSEYLYYEILDAFTYRPLCPSLRGPEERYELLYKLLKNHGIETVVFLGDGDAGHGGGCPGRSLEREYLRVRLMRAGIDPVITTGAEAASAMREYAGRLRGY